MSPVPAIGLCSITYRQLTAEQVIAEALAAGLGAIEWGSDVHVPPGDMGRVREVRDLTSTAGLAICSYGSYFEAGVHPDADFAVIARAAAELGTARVRVWAGIRPSAEVDADEREAIVRSLTAAADSAAGRGLELALEFHEDSLTDSSASTLRLLDEIGRPNVSTYWQAPLALDDEAALEDLASIADRVSAVHVFAWDADGTRHPIAHRRAFFESAFALLTSRGFGGEALLEFVPDDDPAALGAEAAMLRGLVA